VEVEEPGQILESDTIFCQVSAGQFFSTNRTPFTVDLETVAVHEQGHFNGLLHSALAGATMAGSLDPVEGQPDDDFGRTLTSDDRAGVSHLYPSQLFKRTGTIEGRVTVGSLFPGLPSPPPFVGVPIAPGSGAFGAHVVAVNADGIVEASVVTRADGQFVIRGLQGRPPYTVMIDPLDFQSTHISQRRGGLAFSPLLYFRSDLADGVQPGDRLELIVQDALPSRGDGLGIGGIVRPPPELLNHFYALHDPSLPPGFIAVDPEFGAIVLRRGQFIGGGVPTNIPGIFSGSLAFFTTLGPDATVASIDLGPDIRLVGDPVILLQVTPDGQVFGALIVVRAEVDRHARKGLRNVVVVDSSGQRTVRAGLIEVR
jgi:hypothetical protein